MKLVCLLDHKYSHANFHVGALKGVDAQKAAVLSSLAAKHEFVLGLANVRCHVFGFADDGFGHVRHRNGHITFSEIDDQEVLVEHLVDMQGALLAPELEFEEEEEGVDQTFMQAACECRPPVLASFFGRRRRSLNWWRSWRPV